MKALPGDDLFAQALEMLGRKADDPELQEAIAALHAPLHDNCYLSPTQFAEKFGLEVPGHAEDTDETEGGGTEGDGADTDVPSTERGKSVLALYDADVVRAFEPMIIADSDLAGEIFVETRQGVHIFRLTDGRYHVVDHFAVGTLEEAHVAADALAAAGGSA